jgi:hypothetical protein
MLHFHARLIGHRGDAELEPRGIAEAGRDDGKFHTRFLTFGLAIGKYCLILKH